MKNLSRVVLTIMVCFAVQLCCAQTINWKTFVPSQKHVVNINTGLDNGMTFGVGYGYHFNTKMPLLVNVEYSIPGGNDLFDDFKTKIGGQLNVWHSSTIYTSVKVNGIVRRFETSMARLINFGSEFSGTAGFYKSKWFAAVEFGFDKAIITHIKHSDIAKQYNPGIKSDWYEATGGQFFYGLQVGYSLKRSDIYLKGGQTVFQDFQTQPSLPFFLQVGWSFKFKSL